MVSNSNCQTSRVKTDAVSLTHTGWQIFVLSPSSAPLFAKIDPVVVNYQKNTS